MPAEGDRFDFGGLRQFLQAVCFTNGHTDPQIAGGKHVFPPEREDQKHVRRPNADTLYGCEVLDYFGVARGWQLCEIHRSRARMAGQVANILDLLARKTERAHAYGT